MKTAPRKIQVTREVKVDKGTVKASGNDVKETAWKKDGNPQDDSIITKGINFPKELRKRKRGADAEIAHATRLRPRKEVPSFQIVELNDNDSKRIVGMRIKVYWPDSRKWFAGRIKSFDRVKMFHKINYDDGDVEDLDLTKEKFELELKPSDGFHIKTEPRSRKSKKDMKKRKCNADAEISQAILSSTDTYSSRLRQRKVVPSFQMVELNENDSVRIVGMRIKVYWPDSRKWFGGRIKSFDREKMFHRINYDDGDVEELDLKKEKFELEVKPNDGFHIKTELRSRKSKKNLGDHVVTSTSFRQEYDEVKHNAEIEGESTESAEPKEDMESNPGKQQPADNKSEKDERKVLQGKNWV